ncbi:MAG: family 10 glycosylhydrolase [Myxococcota bacterium]
MIVTASLALLLSCARTGNKAPAPDPGPAPEPEPEPIDLVDVQAPREFRGVWIATVFNLDFPSRANLPAETGKAELQNLVGALADRGLNTLVFQVRSEGDAMYASDLEPWSRFLSGRQGRDPGYDPLSVMIEAAHDRGLEVHAWFNPYRAAAKRGAATDPSHISVWAKKHLISWGGVAWLDPGAKPVQDRAVEVIGDVLDRYPIDGVHLDDYFYPYPRGRKAFPDSGTYQAYRNQGGQLGRADWRRQNVDTLVERIWTLVRDKCDHCRLGISPFGIYRPGRPPGITGMDQVTALYADPLVWHRKGWMDYLAPQLYWPTTKRRQAYDRLLAYWNDQVNPESPLVVGLDATRAGKSGWPMSEYRTQVRLSREASNTLGQIWFRASPIVKNQAGIGNLLSELYAAPALPLASRHTEPAAPPTVELVEGGVTLSHPTPEAVRSYVIYRAEPAPSPTTTFDRIVQTPNVTLEPGTWAVSVVLKGAVESQGVRVTVN